MVKIDFFELEKIIDAKLPNEVQILNFVDLGFERDCVTAGSTFNLNNFVYLCDKKKAWNEDIIVDYFISNKDIKNYWISRTRGDFWEEEKRYLGLAFTSNPSSGLIVFSVNDKDRGTVWLEFPGYITVNGCEINRIFLDNDIISFLSKLERGLYTDRVQKFLPLENNLYKNWGEDFWRIRK